MTDVSASGVLSVAVAAFIALLFARAALHKLDDVDQFRAVLGAYELAPASIAPALAYLIAPAELAAAAMILTPWTFEAGASLMTVMLLGYGAAMAINLARGRDDIDCGCGGKPEPLSWALVGRNVVLAGAGALAVIAGPALSAPEIGVALALAVLIFLLWIAGEQAIQNHAYWQARRAATAQYVFGRRA